MAFDGITISAIVKEIRDAALGARLYKLAQPEEDELLITLKTDRGVTKRLVLSASPSLPLVYLTDENKQSPITAPSFCMLLRKHIQNGRIIDVKQPGLERIISIEIEHLDEMGDLCKKSLIIELMGKHSNIMLVNDKGVIIDAIKHIPISVSSVRQVLPGREYFVPENNKKDNPLDTDFESFAKKIAANPDNPEKAICAGYEGISMFYAGQICLRAESEGSLHNSDDESNTNLSFNDCVKEKISLHKTNALYKAFDASMNLIKEGRFTPTVAFENGEPFEYAPLPLYGFNKDCLKAYESVSSMLISYYREKEIISRIRQRSSDLQRIVKTHLERDIKKYDLQLKQLKDTEKADKYRLYGELLNTYGYDIKKGEKEAEVLNYYTNENIKIPLDTELDALKNAQKYFDKYNKLKRTRAALLKLTVEVKEEIDHLLSIQNSLDMAKSAEDLSEIKEELILGGYIKRRTGEKTKKSRSKPLHYRTKEGFDIYVGKNNIQNEYITFEIANGGDWWFHAKKIPGSHVIVKTNGEEIPDSVFEDAARLAAHYSKAEGADKVEVDYVRRKEVKHPNGSKPGFVVYYTNYSMLIDSDISKLVLLDE